ncbi:Zinc-binding dehydrogenase family [Tolypocladium capitatum]|uniref:Zinc-binding dehydrogenase family n=1 Tax=Tolypocladium capitatum TaxID=45235 RepID=A0A2K3Q6Z6_9HYPO|nr:Zinc-binding dehydrogenase family [Tolypocladium capitatum]
MFTVPTTMRAIVQGSDPPGKQILSTIAVPEPRPDEVLVRVHAVAINPCDWKMPSRFPTPGASSGSDFAGVVVRLGSAVAATPGLGIRVGDRVSSAVHGANPVDPTTGSFAEYVCAVAALTWKVPSSMSFDDAAAIGGCGIGTAGLALFAPDTMGLRFEAEDDDYQLLDGPSSASAPRKPFVLVYGGSTATGTMAIQLLKLHYGAEKVFDHRSPTCVADIKDYTRGTLRYVLDIITDARSVAVCEAVIGRGGGRYVGLEALPEDVLAGKGVRSRSVKWNWVLGISLVGRGEALEEPYRFEFNQERRDWGENWFRHLVQDVVDRGLIKPHPPSVRPGGLASVPEGVQMLEKGQVRGEKLVYHIAD